MTVRILLQNPKTPFNVGSAIRAASCYGADDLLYTGDRIDRALAMRNSKVANPRKARRLPREERIRDYDNVQWAGISDEEAIVFLDSFRRDRTGRIVCIELLKGAQPLTWFEHPRSAIDVLYMFGPEDGTVTKEWREYADSFVFIPTKHCINLAAAVYTVLYDRQLKLAQKGEWRPLSMEETLSAGRS